MPLFPSEGGGLMPRQSLGPTLDVADCAIIQRKTPASLVPNRVLFRMSPSAPAQRCGMIQ